MRSVDSTRGPVATPRGSFDDEYAGGVRRGAQAPPSTRSTISADARRLRLTRDGVEVTLTPKALGVLEHLVRHAGAVVTKQTLLDGVWPNVVVEEGCA